MQHEGINTAYADSSLATQHLHVMAVRLLLMMYECSQKILVKFVKHRR